MNPVADLIYQQVNLMPAGIAREVLDFVEFLAHKYQPGVAPLNPPMSPTYYEPSFNDTTWQAWQEIQAGGGQTFQTVEELFEDLESETQDE